MGQIAGRAGRHISNGTFGVTGQVAPFDDELVERLETHDFDPVQVLIWRNRDLVLRQRSTDLRASLETASDNRLLMKSLPGARSWWRWPISRATRKWRRLCKSEADIRLLWDVCQVPDYRNISPASMPGCCGNIFLDLARTGMIRRRLVRRAGAR